MGRRSLRSAAAVPVAIAIAMAASARAPAPSAAPAPLMAPSGLPASSEPIALAGTLHSGLWEVRFSDGGGDVVQRLCIGDPALLIQLRHHRAGCGRFVIANDADSATVQYSCPGAGWGRTTLHAAGAENLRIDTQGIADKLPFAFSAVARRTGDCIATTASATH